MANCYCPIVTGHCKEDSYDYPCSFWNQKDKCCLIKSTLDKLSETADAIRIVAENMRNSGDTPNPNGKVQKGE